jgi:putative ABC transport system permease protein
VCLVLPRLRARLVRGIDTLWIDLRWAARAIARQPGITCLVVISLAIGIGANVTIFSVVDTFLVRSLPYQEAERLVDVHGTVPERGWRHTTQSLPDIIDLRDQSRTMDLAGHYTVSFNLSGESRPERVRGGRVSWNFFDVLQVIPHLGRSFRPEEEQAGSSHVAVISSGLWHRRYSADPEVIGRSLLLDGEPYTVIGVLPASFWFEGRTTEVWTPFGITGEESRSGRGMQSLARLQPGVTLQQARAEVEEIARRLEQRFPQTNQGWSAGVRPLHERVFAPEMRRGGLISVVAAALVLLIACANVANLQLARGADRMREIALRTALGASRRRLVRQLLTEAMVLATLAGALGTVLSLATVEALSSFAASWFPGIRAFAVDGRALLFALVVTALTGIVFGTLPALRSARSDSNQALKEGGRGAVGPGSGRLSKVLVASEVALALILLVCCALLVQGFSRLQQTDWGWRVENLLTFKLALPESQYASDESVVEFYERLQTDLLSLPGVEAAAGTEILPLRGENNTYYNLIGQEVADDQRPIISTRMVLPGYFQALGIPMIMGRTITEADHSERRFVVVINQTLAARHQWPGGDPIGHKVQIWREDFEVVGVVQDTLDLGREARPMGFVPASLEPLRALSMVLHTGLEPALLVTSVRTAVAEIDPQLPIYEVMTMTELMAEENGGYAVMPRLMAALAVIALVLGLIGVYGVIARSVSRRTREVGIRMAMGAHPSDVLGMVMGQGIRLVGIGVVLGIAISAAVTRSLSLFLFGVSPFDALTFALVALSLVAAGLVATLIPARRATHISPMQALRNE